MPFPPLMVLFQFHIVRLKESQREEVYASTPFQFHIVRLKGIEQLVKLKEDKQVSIPYSSIKRQTNLKNVPLYPVSIPYSSIKRWNASSSVG